MRFLMADFTAGRFSAIVYGGAHPIAIDVWDGVTRIRFNHREIRDLQYVLERAKRKVECVLSEKDRLEV
jgi:hypothetical protein